MSLFMSISVLIVSLSMLLMFLAPILGGYGVSGREEGSSYECGFDSVSKARTPFSLRFFLIALVFLVFDVEVSLLLPLGLISSEGGTFVLVSGTLINLLLTFGLIYEWKEGLISWTS